MINTIAPTALIPFCQLLDNRHTRLPRDNIKFEPLWCPVLPYYYQSQYPTTIVDNRLEYLASPSSVRHHYVLSPACRVVKKKCGIIPALLDFLETLKNFMNEFWRGYHTKIAFCSGCFCYV
ncbi:hypothetical protein Plhal703r1_c18g0084231 [Plasmopara halstedii]